MYTIFVPSFKEAAAIFPASSRSEQNGFSGVFYREKFIYVTGMGKANCAAVLSRFLSTNRADGGVLLMGIAGAYKGSGLSIGDLVLVNADHFVDEARLTGDKLEPLNVTPDNRVVFDVPQEFGLPVCAANTVSLLPGTDGMAEMYRNATGAKVESMEGAAFGLTAAMYGVKAVQVRAVSNFCGDKATAQWDAKAACAKLLTHAEKYLSNSV